MRSFLLLCLLSCGLAFAEPSPPPLVIGVYAPLSGSEAGFGTTMLNGAQLAADEINGGGLQHVELRVVDDGGDDERTADAVHDLIEKEHVDALLGDVTSSRSVIGAEICQHARIPMLTPSASDPRVTRGREFAFRMCWIDPVAAEAMARFARGTLKARAAALLVQSDSEFYEGQGKEFVSTFKKQGGKLVAQQTYRVDDASFAAPLAALAAAKPDVIYVAGAYPEGIKIADQATLLKLKCPLLGGESWDATPLRESVGNLYYTPQVALTAKRAVMTSFVRRYYARFHADPDGLSVLGYDSVRLLADAERRAGTKDPAKLRDALASTRNFNGISGATTMAAGGNPRKPVVIVHTGGGAAQAVGEVDVP